MHRKFSGCSAVATNGCTTPTSHPNMAASNRKTKNPPSTVPEIQQLRNETTNLTRQLRAEMTTILEAIAEMKEFQGFLSEQLDQLRQDVNRLSKDQRSIKTSLDTSQAVNRQVASNIEQLEAEVERTKRARNVMILGYPTTAKEDTVQVVLKIAAVLGCSVPRGAVEEARRLPGARSQPIRVVFGGERYKRELLQSAKSFGQLKLSMVDSSIAGSWEIFVRDDTPRSGLRKGLGSLGSVCSK